MQQISPLAWIEPEPAFLEFLGAQTMNSEGTKWACRLVCQHRGTAV